MKKISLLLVLFLFGCQSLSKKLITQDVSLNAEQNNQQTLGILDSGELQTQRFSAKKIKVAIFVPTSGKYKDLGNSLFNSATLSLFENDLNHNIELVLIDSKDNPEDTKKAFKEIINKDIKLVIGPVFSSVIEAIEKDAKRNEITVISLSNNQELANKIDDDGGIFVAGMLLETQVDKIVGYAISRGKKTFSIIAPNNQYGKTLTDIFRTVVNSRDGKFVTSDFYSSATKDLDRVVGNVINSFTIPNRLIDSKNKVKKDVTISENDRIYSQVIMIPESGKILSKIVSSINRQNTQERDFQIVGTSTWDDISTMNDPNLVGAWFAAPNSEKFREFEKRYYQLFDKFPPRVSSIAYDLTKAMIDLVVLKQEEIPTVEDFVNYKTNSSNRFEGIDGQFRFLPNGLVERNLSVLQVMPGRFDTIDKPLEKLLKY